MHEPGRLEGAFQHLAEAVEVHRFDEIIEGAALHGFDGGARRAMRGDEDDRLLGIDRLNIREDLHAGPVGELQIEYDDVGGMFAELVQPFRCGTGRQDVGILSLENAPEGVAHAFFIVDHEESRHCFSSEW